MCRLSRGGSSRVGFLVVRVRLGFVRVGGLLLGGLRIGGLGVCASRRGGRGK